MANHYDSIPFNRVNPFAKLLSYHYDVSDEQQIHLLNRAHAAFMVLVACFSWNVISVTSLWLQGEVETKTLLLAIAYLVFGVPAAYVSWFRPLCLAFRTENAAMFKRFSLFFIVHIVFCVFAAASPPLLSNGRSLTGFLSALDLFYNGPGLIGFLYFIGFLLFTAEVVISIWVLNRVNAYHRQSGLALEMI